MENNVNGNDPVLNDSNKPAPEETGLTFNIVFTPDAFKYQFLFLLSLLKHLRCRFRIVANGCEPGEIRQMEAFCAKHERVELLCLPFSKMLHHSHVLSYLQQKETSPFFCFMDSDILATGNFLASFLPLMNRYDAVFSGRPIWQEEGKEVMPAKHNRVMGRYLWNSKGLFVGCSYFAVYRNDSLNRIREKCQISFDRKYWQDLSPRVRLLLVKMGLPAQFFDTAKVLNILLQEAGIKLVQQESPDLHHIGGLSSGVLRGPQGHLHLSTPSSKETLIKRVVNAYFQEILKALFNKTPLPPVPEISNATVSHDVELTRRHVIDAYKEFFET